MISPVHKLDNSKHNSLAVQTSACLLYQSCYPTANVTLSDEYVFIIIHYITGMYSGNVALQEDETLEDSEHATS